MYYSEAEKAFQDEVREKKKTASGIHHKKGSRGYVGTMRFPSDIMSRKDKYNYRRAGKVMITNLYTDILTIEEFEKLDKEEQRNRLIYWRSVYSNKEITDKMGIWNARYYKIVGELDLPKAPRINKDSKPKRKATTKAAAIKPQQAELFAEEPVAPVAPVAAPAAPTAPIQEIMVDGMHLIFNGTYTAEQIIRQLSKFELLLDGEDDPFYIELKLVQKRQPKEEKKENNILV